MTKNWCHQLLFSPRLLDLSQLLMNKDLKTSEGPVPTKYAISVFSPWKDSPIPLKGAPLLSQHLQGGCLQRRSNEQCRVNRHAGALKPCEWCCQHSWGSLIQEETGKHAEIGKIYLISNTFLKMFKYETKSYHPTSFQLLWYHKINLQLEKQHVCFYKVWKYKCSKC